MNIDFGKRTTHESYFNGALKSTKVEVEIPELIKDKTQALTELMKCLELIDTRQTNHLTIVVQADPKTGNIKLISKKYIINS
jgi:hypothetical protein